MPGDNTSIINVVREPIEALDNHTSMREQLFRHLYTKNWIKSELDTFSIAFNRSAVDLFDAYQNFNDYDNTVILFSFIYDLQEKRFISNEELKELNKSIYESTLKLIEENNIYRFTYKTPRYRSITVVLDTSYMACNAYDLIGLRDDEGKAYPIHRTVKGDYGSTSTIFFYDTNVAKSYLRAGRYRELPVSDPLDFVYLEDSLFFDFKPFTFVSDFQKELIELERLGLVFLSHRTTLNYSDLAKDGILESGKRKDILLSKWKSLSSLEDVVNFNKFSLWELTMFRNISQKTTRDELRRFVNWYRNNKSDILHFISKWKEAIKSDRDEQVHGDDYDPSTDLYLFPLDWQSVQKPIHVATYIYILYLLERVDSSEFDIEKLRLKKHSIQIIKDLLSMSHQLKIKWEFLKTGFQSIKNEHDRLDIIIRNKTIKKELKDFKFKESVEWKGVKESLKKDAPGLGLTCKRLFSARELVREGDEMNHCVASYAHRVAKSNTFIFHVDSDLDEPEHKGYTVQVNFYGDDGYRIVQMYGHSNTEVSAPISKRIITLLELASDRQKRVVKKQQDRGKQSKKKK